MREIKFRAWDKNEKAMRLVSGLFFPNFPCREEYVVKTPTHVDVVIPSERFELMQFTGLKDKNGKEIYEGDICLTNLREWSDERQSIEIRPIHLEIIHDGTGARFCAREKSMTGQWDFHDGMTNNLEIIGNVYENPELLK